MSRRWSPGAGPSRKAIGQLRREHATIQGLARQLGTSWKTVWLAFEPEFVKLAADESQFEDVTTLGVDEHIWHHSNPKTRGAKELTGMVDLSRDSTGKTRARLLDLVRGRSGKAYASWLGDRSDAFRKNVKVAAFDTFAGYKTTIDDKLQDATAVLDAFHVVKLGTAAVDEVRRRVQQDTLGHCGRKGDPRFGVQNILRVGAENLTDKQRTRLARAIEADEAHDGVFLAWQCAQQLRSAYQQKDLADGRRIAERVVNSFHTCTIPEIARLGRTLRRWRSAFLAHFTTSRRPTEEQRP
jgi:transposase